MTKVHDCHVKCFFSGGRTFLEESIYSRNISLLLLVEYASKNCTEGRGGGKKGDGSPPSFNVNSIFQFLTTLFFTAP